MGLPGWQGVYVEPNGIQMPPDASRAALRCCQSVLESVSWQKLNACVVHELLIAYRPPHCLTFPVLLPMCPGLLRGGVRHELVEIGWYLHFVGADARGVSPRAIRQVNSRSERFTPDAKTA